VSDATLKGSWQRALIWLVIRVVVLLNKEMRKDTQVRLITSPKWWPFPQRL